MTTYTIQVTIQKYNKPVRWPYSWQFLYDPGSDDLTTTVEAIGDSTRRALLSLATDQLGEEDKKDGV